MTAEPVRKLCHDRRGELEQIQFLLGHASVQTTERYLGCKQNLGHPVNDLFDLRTGAQQQAEHEEFVPASGASEAVEKAQEPGEAGISGHHVGLPHAYGGNKQPALPTLKWQGLSALDPTGETIRSCVVGLV